MENFCPFLNCPAHLGADLQNFAAELMADHHGWSATSLGTRLWSAPWMAAL